MMIVQHGGLGETRVVDQFEPVDLGSPFKIVLHNSVSVTSDPITGQMVSYKLPNPNGLFRAIVFARLLDPLKLSGSELRFIRKAIHVQQKVAASKIEVSAEHLSRCEAGNGCLSPSSEKLFRVFALKASFKLHKLKAESEEKAIIEMRSRLEEALDRLFDDFNLVSARSSDKPLEFHFEAKHDNQEVNECSSCDDHSDWELAA